MPSKSKISISLARRFDRSKHLPESAEQKARLETSYEPRRGQLALVIGSIYRQWRKHVDLSLKELELTDAMRAPLLMLQRVEVPVRQKDLARMLYLDSSSLVRILDQLRAMELVDWQTALVDRRTKYITLTPSGRILAEKISSKSLDIEERLLHNLSSKELDFMRKGLEKISRNFEAL